MLKKSKQDATEFIAGDATRLREILHPSHDPVAIGYSLAHAFLPKGAASLPHRLEGSETYYILQGTGTIYIDGQATPLGPDDVCWVPPNALQHVENTGDSDLVFLCIVEPYWRPEEETVEE